MKQIKDINSLFQRLSSSNKSWQKTFYEATGVIMTESHELFSNCGRNIDLNNDSEYSSDDPNYCEINTVDELIAYIKEMESYTGLLVDMSYGKFSKSDLYWGIFDRILLQPENLGDFGEKYDIGGLYGIGQNWDLYNIGLWENRVMLHMALIACDSINIDINISENTSLDDALNMVAAELNTIMELNPDSIEQQPPQKVFDVSYTVPKTYEELMARYSQGMWYLA